MIIDAFVDGTGGKWDWDDFTSTRFRDPLLERARQRAVAIHDLFPAIEGKGYCSHDGLEELRRIARELKTSE